MPKSVSEDINALFEAAREGDPKAERQLLDKLSVRFRLFAYQRIWNQDEAAELAQEALLTIAQEYKSLEVQKSFTAWAYRVMENRLLSRMRSHRVRREAFEREGIAERQRAVDNPQPELKRKLLECLQRVGGANRRYARILNLNYQGFSTQDICRKLGITENHCYVLLSRARAMLEKCLDQGDVS